MKTANGLGRGTSRQQTAPPLLELPDGLCCPGCKGTLTPQGVDARCAGCGKAVVVHGSRIPDLLGGKNPAVEAVLGWPDDFVGRAEPWLLALASGAPLSAEALAELEARRLVDSGSRLTALGSNLAYHCKEFSRQSTRDGDGNFLERLPHLSTLGTGATVLDVGCGAGQTLRLLQPYRPAERIGFDIDLEALAFGCRLAESNCDAIRFVRGSAYHIPFPDHRFTRVICRVALNYVHQRRALAEMVRVLQPGGYLYCSVEGPGFDFHFLKQARTAAQLLCRLRDLFYGLSLALTGVQPAPGSRLTGGRAFGTVRRCARVLSRAGCEVVHAETTSRYLGLPKGFDLVVRKR